MIEKLLIANRGEIACRIARTARRLRIPTVAVYSDADAQALHVSATDEHVHIGSGPATQSYLSIDAILHAAAQTGATAIHPGYGFLSESAEFAERVADAGLTFVGPSADAMRRLGAKDAAKQVAREANVPIVPGYFDAAADHGTLSREARAIGFPLVVKAVSGGGGRGMRVVREADALPEALDGAAREARQAFGDDRLMLERLVERPRHIEVQVFGDTHGNVVHLFERDCTLQRRHQKVVEEAPAPGMSAELRAAMTEAAVRLAGHVGYTGAGTVEFLVEGGTLAADAPFYFIEMNTRLQVEHPVTEAITGFDLVEWQLRIAAGEKLPAAQAEISHRGHAIEVRLYAEDPENDFAPAVGTLDRLDLPEAARDVRIDTGFRTGDAVSPFYDAMLAKIITQGSDRSLALSTLTRALDEVVVFGLPTNTSFLARLLSEPDVETPDGSKADYDTGLIARVIDRLTANEADAVNQAARAGLDALLADEPDSPFDVWNRRDGFVLGGHRTDAVELVVDGEPTTLAVDWQADTLRGDTQSDLGADGSVLVWHARRAWRVARTSPGRADAEDALADGGTGIIVAPITGRVAQLVVSADAPIEAGETIAVIEAMKMEHVVRADVSGAVKRIVCALDAQVAAGDLLVEIEPEQAPV